MRQPLVVGNWKMNGSFETISELMAGLKAGLAEVSTVNVAVCPAVVFLDRVASLIVDSSISLGAQTASEYDSGPYTGETSVAMLKEFECRYVILGHSERRALFAEKDVQISAKYKAVKAAGLTPILCVGETLAQREDARAQEVIFSQLDAVLETLGVDWLEGAVVAYEPVWAIGSGKTATPEQAQEIHRAIRDRVAQKSKQVAERLPIIYGGSVNAANAESLFSMTDIDGALVGGASLKVDEFVAICRAAKC
ncbi:MAG: triosephosphate isomerase [Motiliproteus sp.]|jgi:triosephosphate isomerase